MVVGPSLVIIRGDSESSRNVPLGVPESLGSNCGFLRCKLGTNWTESCRVRSILPELGSTEGSTDASWFSDQARHHETATHPILFQQFLLEPLERFHQPRDKGLFIVAASGDDLELVLDP